jgi:hypothetical protein
MPECPEPSIDELLADPLIRALMAADGVDPDELRALLCSAAERLRACATKPDSGPPK